MATIVGSIGADNPRLATSAIALLGPIARGVFAACGFHHWSSGFAKRRGSELREHLKRGAPAYLAGVGVAGHNTGVALVRVSADNGIELLANNEEERFSGVRHDGSFPIHALAETEEQLREEGACAGDVFAWLGTWSYADFVTHGLRVFFEHLPRTVSLIRPSSNTTFSYVDALQTLRAPARLGRALGFPRRPSLIGLRHHDNHAYMAYLSSPFAADAADTVISVIDGFGDDGAISLYRAGGGSLARIFCNNSIMDSLGLVYAMLSSTQGGWTVLSSEGRYMGAAAWGDGDRLTNPYYRRLRQLFYFGPNGQVALNRAMAAIHLYGERRPYGRLLREILGEPIPRSRMWNPDCVLRVEDVEHSPITEDRVDRAAAAQLVFEDAVFHVISHLLISTKSDRLVMAGGTALNCVANMKLMERFDTSFYKRYIGRSTRLSLWVPPTPSDQGVMIGAAYQFACGHGLLPAKPMRHAFHCGREFDESSIRKALGAASDVGALSLGALSREQIADLLAFVIVRDGIVGLFQGRAETGPRALGHRSILANPRNPRTLAEINSRVKYREPIRPLAPMVTYEAAKALFELSAGGTNLEHDAYNYMVLTARARPEALKLIPAVVHRDGTCRIQIVRHDIDPFTHAFLRAMGRRSGVEAAVNTSLNVGSPIVQSPEQALEAMRRAAGMDGLLFLAGEGPAFLTWHSLVRAPKDGGRRLRGWYDDWRANAHLSARAG
jgi:carbamoyltransferase